MLRSPHSNQSELFQLSELPIPPSGGSGPFRSQLLKWVGNKQKQADTIIRFFPAAFDWYFEPFLGVRSRMIGFCIIGVLCSSGAMS